MNYITMEGDRASGSAYGSPPMIFRGKAPVRGLGTPETEEKCEISVQF